MARPTHQFTQTKTAEIPRSSFDLSHGLKTTFDAGLIIPILSLEVLPGDTINCRASLFGRLATPIKPVLDNLYLETHFFFTPWRQVYPDFVKLMGEQESPGDSIDFTIPQINWTDTELGEATLGDYMGIPPVDGATTSALPFRAINAIFNYWYRDENLVPPRPVPLDAGPDDPTANEYITPPRRRKRRDYITAGLPFPQKGPAVTIDLGGNAPVYGIGVLTDAVAASGGSGIYKETDGQVSDWSANFNSNLINIAVESDVAGATGNPQIYADLQQATGFTINDLRESFQIQKLLERDARGGTRYPEILMSHFRVNDPMLLVHQRPLFLGGGGSRINITPVQQMSETNPDGDPNVETPQGNLAAYGTVSGNNHGFTSSFTEHGIIIGFVNVRADLTYQQGLERYWNRTTRYDFYWPALSHLGEQAVRNSEVYLSGDPVIDDGTFSYMPRYDEYRYKQSQITGLFRSSANASLDVWHLAQDFASLPALDQAFIEDNPPIDRVVAVPSEPDLILDVYFKIKAARPLPLYATPGLIDHF